LEDNQCPNAGDLEVEEDLWLSVSTPAVRARLNKAAPGSNLAARDVYSIMSLCAFDTVAKNGIQSPICNIFSTEEFYNIFQYAGDLDKYYGTG
jgi:hypothetical protein